MKVVNPSYVADNTNIKAALMFYSFITGFTICYTLGRGAIQSGCIFLLLSLNSLPRLHRLPPLPYTSSTLRVVAEPSPLLFLITAPTRPLSPSRTTPRSSPSATPRCSSSSARRTLKLSRRFKRSSRVDFRLNVNFVDFGFPLLLHPTFPRILYPAFTLHTDAACNPPLLPTIPSSP